MSSDFHISEENGRRILLIEPPYFRLFKSTYSLDRIPHGLLNIASAILSETDWEVLVYNADFSGVSEAHKVSYQAGAGFDEFLRNLNNEESKIWREVRSKILRIRPSVVGITAKSPNFKSACIVAKLAKEVDRNTIVVMGGSHVSLTGAKSLNCTDIDILVRGEGELTIVQLLRRIGSRSSIEGVRGILYRKDGTVIEEGRPDHMTDLDRLSYVHMTARKVLVDYEEYLIHAFKHIYTSRGCPYDCFFCSSKALWGRKVRFRSPKKVLEEIKDLQQRGLRYVQFQDDTFGVDRDYLRELCKGILKHCPGLRWGCLTHVNLVDEEVMSLMKDAGCLSVDIGIESGNNEILQQIRKNFTIEEALAACEIIRKCGIKVGAFFQIGFPYETEATLADTVSVMKKVKASRLIYSIFTPHPGTEAYDFCRQNDLLDDFDVSLYNHQSPRNCFCFHIPHGRFRELASDIEKMVDRRNTINRAQQLLSRNAFRRMGEVGVKKGLRAASRRFFGW